MNDAFFHYSDIEEFLSCKAHGVDLADMRGWLGSAGVSVSVIVSVSGCPSAPILHSYLTTGTGRLQGPSMKL